MNKKKLSVVMAGAMLATSVAPVLAAPVEYGTSQKKLVEKEVMDLVNSKKISTNATIKGANGNAETDFVSTKVAEIMQKSTISQESAYGIKVLNKDGKAMDLNAKSIDGGSNNGFNIADTSKLEDNNTLTYDVDTIETILTSTNLVAGMTVQVVERENSKFLGEVIPGSEITGKGVSEKNKLKYENLTSLAELQKVIDVTLASTATNPTTVSDSDYIKSVSLEKGVATITLNAVEDITAAEPKNIKIELKEGSSNLYFKLPIDSEGNLVKGSDNEQDCVDFVEKETFNKSQITKEDPELKSEYKLVDDSVKAEQVTLLAKDLYDGFALTAKGTEIQADIKNAKKVATETGKAATVAVDNSKIDTAVNGVYSFKVVYYASHKDVVKGETAAKKVVTIKSTNKKEIASLYNMLNDGSFRVGIVGGENRYETAVNVAKQHGVEVIPGDASVADNNHIVLVNGDSLVDGLAAAPLAAAKKFGGDTGTAVLLTKADSLPTATREFLEKMVLNVPKANMKNITIDLVGGEAVLNESLVDELKEMGFKVVRYGGDDREETSLEVASAVENGTKKGAFIVGGTGEADAMSIASVAVEKGMPIIVSSVHGLTKDALKYVENRKNQPMTIVGGESVVSAEEYAKLDELTADNNAVKRVSGKNRFETNAAVIKEYYSTLSNKAEGVVLVKDGVATKNELIDALSAANYAAEMHAPIVLASTSLKDIQKNALLNVDTISNMDKNGTVAQVGIGAERTVLETIAGLFGISNVK